MIKEITLNGKLHRLTLKAYNGQEPTAAALSEFETVMQKAKEFDALADECNDWKKEIASLHAEIDSLRDDNSDLAFAREVEAEKSDKAKLEAANARKEVVAAQKKLLIWGFVFITMSVICLGAAVFSYFHLPFFP